MNWKWQGNFHFSKSNRLFDFWTFWQGCHPSRTTPCWGLLIDFLFLLLHESIVNSQVWPWFGVWQNVYKEMFRKATSLSCDLLLRIQFPWFAMLTTQCVQQFDQLMEIVQDSLNFLGICFLCEHYVSLIIVFSFAACFEWTMFVVRKWSALKLGL